MQLAQLTSMVDPVNMHALCAGGREFEYPRPAKSYTALQMVRHHFNIYASSCVALAL